MNGVLTCIVRRLSTSCFLQIKIQLSFIIHYYCIILQDVSSASESEGGIEKERHSPVVQRMNEYKRRKQAQKEEDEALNIINKRYFSLFFFTILYVTFLFISLLFLIITFLTLFYLIINFHVILK